MNLEDLQLNNLLYRNTSQVSTTSSNLVADQDTTTAPTEVAPENIVGGEMDSNLSLVGGLIQSKNFVTGSTGWRITADGNAEFSSGYFRGDITGASGTFTGEVTATSGTIGGWEITASSLYATTTGTIKTSATVGVGSNGVIMDKDGLRMYDSILGQVVNLPSNGDAPTFSSGIINETIFEISTNSVLRTSSTAVDGTASSAGVLINSTGIYAAQANQSTTTANIRILATGAAFFAGTVTADTLILGGGQEITISSGDSIQDALDAVSAAGGGSVLLSPGAYTQTTALTVYSNTKIQGRSSNNTTITFAGTAANITLTGTDVYTTGTIVSIATGVTVTGSGTTWTSAMIGRQIFISNRWYVIASRTSNTEITLATGYADGATYAGTYRIASPIANVNIIGVTLTGSTGTAVVGTDVRDIGFNDVVFASNNKGYALTNIMSFIVDTVAIASNTSNGYEITNGSFCNHYSVASVSNGGSGVVLNNIKTCGWILSASNSNTTDGFNCTNVDSCLFKVEVAGNGGQGIEFVSGCDTNTINDTLANGNTSDGIKLTATDDNNTITGCIITNNGGYGVNVAASTCDNNNVYNNQYYNNTSGIFNDAGTNTNSNFEPAILTLKSFTVTTLPISYLTVGFNSPSAFIN